MSRYPKIDWSNPLTRELEFCSVGSFPDINLVSKARATLSNTFTTRPGAGGMGLDPDFLAWDHLDDNFYSKVYDTNRAFGHASFHLATRESDTGGTDTLFVMQHNNNRQSIYATQAASNEKLQIRYTDAAGGVVSTGNVTPTPWTLGDQSPHSIGQSCEVDGTLHLFVDGQDAGVPATTENPGYEAFTNEQGHAVGSGIGGAADWPGIIYLTLVWLRPLSAAEHAEIHRNPWQIFEKEEYYVPFNVEPAAEEVEEETTELFDCFEKPWTKQPPPGTPIDWDNPITKGLVVAISGNSQRELINGTESSKTGSPTATGASFGLAHSNDLPNNSRWLPPLSNLHGSDKITLFALVRPTDLAGSETYGGIFGVSNNGDTVFRLARATATGGIVDANGLLSGRAQTAPALFDGQWTQIVSKADAHTDFPGADFALNTYKLNGEVIEQSTPTYSDGTISASANQIHTAAIYSNSNRLIGDFGLGLVWNRRITDQEEASLVQNPWQIFKPKRIPVFREIPQERLIKAKKPWTKQPPAGTPIDWNNPITQGITFCASMQDGGRELISGDVPLFSSGATIVPTDQGLAYQGSLDGSEALEYTKEDTRYTGNTEFTVFAYIKNRKGTISATGNESIFGHAGGGIEDPFNLGWGQGEDVSAAISTNFAGGTTYTDFYDEVYDSATLGGIDPREWHGLGLIWKNDLIVTCISDRRSPGLATEGIMAVANNIDNIPRIGGTGSNAFDGWVSIAIHWNRALSDTEFNSMEQNPWQIFQPQEVLVPYEYTPIETTSEEKEERLFMFKVNS